MRRMAWNALQVVLAHRLGFDVRALAGQPARRRVHPLAPLLEHQRNRVLGEPVDLQLRVPGTQFGGDSEVAAHMAKPNQQADVDREVPAVPGPRPGSRCRNAVAHRFGEIPDQQVHLDRVTQRRGVPAAVRMIAVCPPVQRASARPVS